MEERAKSALRATKMYFTIESGPREEARILEDQFIKWVLSDPTPERRIGVGVRLLRMALMASEGGRFRQACEHYDELVRIIPEGKNEVEWDLFATAQYNRANMLSEMGRHEEAIAAYTKISDEISALKLVPVAEKWAKAVFNSARIYETRLKKFEMAADCYQSIINRAVGNVGLLPREVVAQSYVNLGRITESADQALVYFNEVIAQHFLSDDRALREQVQKALLNKMYCLISLDRNDDALVVADQVLAYPDPPNNEINIVARSQKVLILEAMGSFEMMLRVEGVEEGLKPLISAEAKGRTIHALLSRAKHLISMKRSDDAIKIYRAIEETLIFEVDGSVLDHLAFAYAAWIETSMESNCEEEVLSLCDSLIRLYDKLPHASAIYYTSWALFLKSHLLAERDDSAGAAAVASEILVKFGPESRTPSEEVYFRAIDARAAHLNDLNEFEAALPLCDQYLERSNRPDAPTTQVGLARTLVCKGNALLRSNRSSEAKPLLEGFVKEFASSEDSVIIGLVEYATALITEVSEKSTDQA
jgi:tetratricopeptide (TPR) repeat protein